MKTKTKNKIFTTKGYSWKNKLIFAWYVLTEKPFQLESVKAIEIYKELFIPKHRVFYKVKP
jgi:hypothetical protein